MASCVVKHGCASRFRGPKVQVLHWFLWFFTTKNCISNCIMSSWFWDIPNFETYPPYTYMHTYFCTYIHMYIYMWCVIHANAHIQLGFLHLLNLRFKGVRPSWCVSKVGQYMQVLNGYFHNQGTGEYWRPFGEKSTKHLGKKDTPQQEMFRIFFWKQICSIISFAPIIFLASNSLYIYIDGVYRRKVPCFYIDVKISIYIYTSTFQGVPMKP